MESSAEPLRCPGGTCGLCRGLGRRDLPQAKHWPVWRGGGISVTVVVRQGGTHKAPERGLQEPEPPTTAVVINCLSNHFWN